MAELSAVFLNCTLKPSPAVSNTEALARQVIEWLGQNWTMRAFLRQIGPSGRLADLDRQLGITK